MKRQELSSLVTDVTQTLSQLTGNKLLQLMQTPIRANGRRYCVTSVNKRRAVSARTRYLFLEETGTPRLGEDFDLGSQILVGGGNACVTESIRHGSRNMGRKLILQNPLLEPVAGLRKG